MKKVLMICFMILSVLGCSQQSVNNQKTYKNFTLDHIYHSKKNGDIHYNLYIPKNYDGKKPYALYFTLPGYQGLYFQGVGENIKTEKFGFMAQKYNKKMIIVAPQLEDWGEKSADQTIDLVEYFLSHYNIDKHKVYANGYSAGGETMSLVMGKRADLFAGYLHASTKWDGSYDSVVENRTPIYIAIGESDEYYGSKQAIETYNAIKELYEKDGLTEKEINQLLVLDVKDSQYFKNTDNQHGGGALLFAKDPHIMGWLFNRRK